MRKDTDGDRTLATILVVAFYLTLGWWLANRPPPEPRRQSDAALHIHWIEPPPPIAPAPEAPVPRRTVPAAPGRAAAKHDDGGRAADHVASDRRRPVATDRSFAARAGAALGRSTGGWPRFSPRSAATRRTRDAGDRPLPHAPAAVVESIGRLVGGPDYTTDPCPQVRRNLAGLAPDGDSDLLREEIRRLRQLCQ